jgi:hypothetical protein
MTKKLVMVEALSQYRMRYVFEVEDDIDHALDEFVMIDGTEDLKEFSQHHLESSVILSHREITKDEYLNIFNEDNDYLKSWDDEKKMTFINVLDYTKEPPLASYYGEEVGNVLWDIAKGEYGAITKEQIDKIIKDINVEK